MASDAVEPNPRAADRADAAHAIAQELVAAQLVASLRAAGVDCLILKGLAIQRLLYEPGTIRRTADVDVLVSPVSFSAAERVMWQLGFVNRYDGPAPEWTAEHAEEWRHDRWPLPVDLHRRLWGFGASPAAVWDALWEGRESMTLAGRDIDVPGAAATALLLAMHAAHHGREVVKPLRELESAVERLDAATWREAAELAAKLDARRALWSGLALVPGGSAVADACAVAASEYGRQAAGDPMEMWTSPAMTEGLVRLAETSGARARARLIFRELVPSTRFMRLYSAHTALARRGRLGLAAAYAMRALALLRSAPRGLTALGRYRPRRSA